MKKNRACIKEKKKKELLNLTPFHKCQWGGYGGIKRKQECALQKSKAMMDPYSKRSRIEKDTNKEQGFFWLLAGRYFF